MLPKKEWILTSKADPTKSYKYLAPVKVGAGYRIQLTSAISESLLASEGAKSLPPTNSPEFEKKFSAYYNSFSNDYPDEFYLLILETILAPVEGAPPIADVYYDLKDTEVLAVINFFMGSVTNKISVDESLPKHGKRIPPKAKASR